MSHRHPDDDPSTLAHPSQAEVDGGGARAAFTRAPAESTEFRRFRSLEERACLSAAAALSRSLREDMEPEQLGHAFVETLRELLPGRRLALRLLDPDGSGQLCFAFATGRLLHGSRDELRVTAHGLRLVGLDPEAAEAVGVRVAAAYENDFENGAAGFDVPVVDAGRVVGILGVEYPALTAPGPGDTAAVAQLTFSLGSVLGRVRLRREATYLRGYLGKLLDHAEVPIMVIGKRRDIRLVSQGLLHILGRRRDELLGADFLSIVPEAERGRLLPLFLAALRGKPLRDFELHVGRDDRITARLEIQISSILDTDGDVEGVMVIGRDLTAIRKLEDQVVQTEKLATLGQLAAGVVHELNNPLTSISVYADHLAREAAREERDEAERKRIDRIVQAADRMQRFTRDLMVYARPSSGERTPVAIASVLDQSVRFCEHVIAKAGVTITRDEAPDLPLIRGVESQLHQVFINLITNACHAIADGEGTVTITTRERAEGGIEIRVADDGPGVPEDLRSSIFEPFFSTKREGEGTGLGLPIVKSIVARHGGAIHLESSTGGGAAFVVELPVAGGPRISLPPADGD